MKKVKRNKIRKIKERREKNLYFKFQVLNASKVFLSITTVKRERPIRRSIYHKTNLIRQWRLDIEGKKIKIQALILDDRELISKES